MLRWLRGRWRAPCGFPPAGETISSDGDFAAYLLEAAEVAVVPGVAFGLSPHFRISYATSTQALEDAMARIGQAVDNLA